MRRRKLPRNSALVSVKRSSKAPRSRPAAPLQLLERLHELVGLGRVELQDRRISGPPRVDAAVLLPDLDARLALGGAHLDRNLQERGVEAVGGGVLGLVHELL